MSIEVCYRELFNLKENFTKDELKASFIQKIKYINNLNIPQIDKKLLTQQYYNQYNLAKNYLYKNINPFNNLMISNMIPNMMPFESISNHLSSLTPESNTNTQMYSKSYSYHSIQNPDGTRTVIESNNNYNNGKNDKKINSYKIDSKGNKTPIKMDNLKNIAN
jgi:hypothetical protein